MNVGLMQFVNNAAPSSNAASNKQSPLLTEGNKFGEVFSKILSDQNKAADTETAAPFDGEFLQKILGMKSLEEILDLLNISYEDGFVTLENEVKNFDELMNMEDLLSIIGLDFADLQQIVSGLLGIELPNNTNIWQFIEQMNENAPQLIAQLQLALSGEHSITPKAAQQFLTFLKAVQVVGNNTDLVMEQPLQLAGLKEIVQTVVKEVIQLKTEGNGQGQITIQNFQQAVEKAVKSETHEQPKVTIQESATNVSGNSNQQPVTTRTVTIQLPADKASQAEQLAQKIERLFSQSQISKNQGIIRLQLKLYPENLGSIRIELIQKDGVLSARLLATTSLGKELLDSQLHQLKHAFVQQNIQLDRIDVQQAIQDKDLRDQSLFNNFFNQQNENDDNEEEEQEQTEEQKETKSFREYLVNVEV